MKYIILYITLIACMLCCAERAAAQYYTWGSDAPSLRWQTIKTPDVSVVYPDTAANLGFRTMRYIQAVKPDIGFGFRHGPMKIPFVLHPENFRSNGLVMWLPMRVEFLSSPEVDNYSMPWIKHLVAHEYRHVVQYNNLERGWIRVASWLFGQQGSFLGFFYMPLWLIEGDATMMETEMSSFGRGLQPRFTIEFRALADEPLKRRNPDKWFCGSYLDIVPDQYQLGYQMCTYTYTRYGHNIWNKVTEYSVRNAYMFLSSSVGLKKFYKTNVENLYRETITDINEFWSKQPKLENSTKSMVELPTKNYTTYKWPLALPDSSVVAFKSDFVRSSRFVRIDSAGHESVICYTGSVSSRPTLGGDRLWWTEYRRSLLFDQRVGSQLCYMDLSDGRARTYSGKRSVLYPTVTEDPLPAWIEYHPNGQFLVVRTDSAGVESHVAAPYQAELHGLAWDDKTRALYVLVTDNSGMWPGRVDADGVKPLREGAYITISDLRARDGKLYFGSIASGRDEAHCLDLATGEERRITTSTYGSFAPSPAEDNTVLVSTYERRGYNVARQPATNGELIAPSRLPVNNLNPVRKKWDVVNLDTVSFAPIDSMALQTKSPPRRYRKLSKMINFHSWTPISFNPFEIMEEHNVKINWGATLLSQNLLSNTEAFVAYGWSRDEGSLVQAAFRYFGLGVQFNVDGTYGGNQMVYSPVAGHGTSDKFPRLQPYYSIGASATLPLYFQRGYHTRQLSVSAGWNFSNGLIAKLEELHFDMHTGLITNIENVGFRKGLHKLSFGVGFSDAVRMAPRDFTSPWSYALSANYSLSPSRGHFSDLISFYAKLATPGFLPHNSFSIAANYQTSIGGFRTPDGQAMLSYKSTRLIPRGMTTADIASNHYTALSLNYEFPIWYPEGGISGLIYFKRIRLNFGGDYAQFRVPSRGPEPWKRLWSYGGDVAFDINVFRMSDAATSTVRLSFFKPSNARLWFTVGFGLPF